MDLREASTELVRRHPWEVARARFFAEILTERLGAQPRAILDVGAGDGYASGEFLARLPAGSEVVCYDDHYTDADLGRLSAGGSPAGARFTREIPARRFDVILLLDVLEHVEDDLGLLSRLVADNLEADGTVLISVPAWPSLYTEHDRAMLHHRRYTPAACRALIAAAHLDLIRSGGLFHTLLPVRALLAIREALARRMGRTARAPADLGQWTKGPLLSELVERALLADNAISRRLADVGLTLPGLSFWALAEPRR